MIVQQKALVSGPFKTALTEAENKIVFNILNTENTRQ